MDEFALRQRAQQLRKPEGESGILMGLEMNNNNKWMNEQTVSYLNISSNDNILEIGMGNGAFVESILMSDETVKYTGCDYSELMINEANRINDKNIQNERAKFYLASADKLPFANDTFHKAFGVNVFYFWENPSIELAEIKRVLKPGGTLVISFRPKNVMINIAYTKYGFGMYTKEDAVKIFDNTKFRNIKTIEMDEPDQVYNGQVIKLQTLIISACK